MLRELVIFPDHFLPIPDWTTESQNKYPRIIAGFSKEEVIGAAIQRMEEVFRPKREKKYPSHQGECVFKFLNIEFQGKVLYLVFQNGNLLVLDPPIQSRSQKQGSKALYYAADKERGLLLQYLSPYSQTSSHDHEVSEWTEYYYLLAGKVTLRTSRELKETKPIIIEPETVHQVSTADYPSLILIEIKGDPNWFEKWLTGEGHCFRQLPAVPWEKNLS